MRILVADDELLLAENISVYLKKQEGIETDVVDSYERMMEQLKQTNYDLIITDNDMSDSSIDDWMDKIVAAHPDIRIVVISASEEVNKYCDTGNYPVIGCFEKPFDLRSLNDVLNSVKKLKRVTPINK